MAECTKCKKELRPEFKACPYCRTMVNSRTCSECGEALEYDFRFCPNCTQPVARPSKSRSTVGSGADRRAKALRFCGSAYKLADAGKDKGAIEDYTRAIEIDPKDAAAYFNRGGSHSKLGDNEQAIEDYTRAIEIDPKYAAAYNNRGIAHRNLGNSEMEAQDFATAKRLREEQTSATKTKSSFKDAKEVDWEVLPPGWWRDSTRVKEIRAGCRTKREADTFIGRLEYVDGFGPLETWEGMDANLSYMR